MVKYEGQLKNITFKTELQTGRNKLPLYCNSIMTLDIEVTSAWLEGNTVIGYTKGKDVEYWNNLTPLALPYIWQFSCDGIVYYGREWSDFLNE